MLLEQQTGQRELREKGSGTEIRSSALAEECKNENKAEVKKNKGQHRKETQGEKINTFPRKEAYTKGAIMLKVFCLCGSCPQKCHKWVLDLN